MARNTLATMPFRYQARGVDRSVGSKKVCQDNPPPQSPAPLLDVPLNGGEAEVDVEQRGAAVHLPQHGRAVIGAPDQVGLA